MAELSSFGEWLKRQRKAGGWTQEQLARQLSCSTITLRKIEAEERRPSAQIVERLAEILNIPPNERTAFLRFARGDWKSVPGGQIEDTPWRPPMGFARSNVPVPPTALIGREQELTDLREYLSNPHTRLITLTGPGGVGKTSLALHVAHGLRDAFVDGAFFVSLGVISEPTLIIPTIAQVLGLNESPNQLLFDSLKAFLRDRQMLLLLDNFEHVISAAPLLTELLATCAELKLLVTSREALRVHGEHEFPLLPLELSRPDLRLGQVPGETLSQYPSIVLFVERAQASLPSFQLTADNALVVAQVCSRLDGLPLAIELAAARIKLLPPQAMLARLQESSLSLLTGGTRDAPERQQTLRNTMQWSYDLLTPDEQRTFRCLSVFVGGCTLEAASTVINTSPHVLSSIVLDNITSLINKSLVRQTESNGEARLVMLETIQEFSLERLEQENELEAVKHAHAKYYLSLAEEAELHLTGREQKAWLKKLGDEQDNLRAALRWGFEHHEAGFVLRLAGALWQFWFMRGQWSEGRRWLEEALSVASKEEVDIAWRAKALYAAATLIRYQFDLERARSLCEQSITLYRTLDNKEGLLSALLLFSRILDFQGDEEAMRSLGPELLVLAEDLPDVPIKAQVYATLPVMLHESINSENTARCLTESERIYRALEHPVGLAYTLLLQGIVADLQGDLARAQSRREEAERLASEVDDQHFKLMSLVGRMIAAWHRGEYDSTRRYIEQMLDTARKLHIDIWKTNLNSTWQSDSLLRILAAVLHRQGFSMWAARVYGLADQLADLSQSPVMGGKFFEPLSKSVEVVRAEVHAQLGDQAFDRALSEGQRMTLEDLLTIPHASPSSSTGRAQSAPVTYEALTARELEVLRLLAQGLSNSQIAEQLIISRRTVDAHLRTIYEKLGVKSRDAAIRVAKEHGMIY